MFRCNLAFALLCCAGLVSASLAQAPITIASRLSAARQHLEQGEFRLAVEHARQAQQLISVSDQKIQAQQAACWDVLADGLEASGQLGQAERSAQQHLALVDRLLLTTPTNVRERQKSLVRLARIAAAMRKNDFARAHYQKALQIPNGLRDDPLWEPAIVLQLPNLEQASATSSQDATLLRQASQRVSLLLKEYRSSRPAIAQLEAAWDIAKQLHLTMATREAAQTAAGELDAWLAELKELPASAIKLHIHLADCHQAAGQPEAEAHSLRHAIELLRSASSGAGEQLQIATLLGRLSKLPLAANDSGPAARNEALEILQRLTTNEAKSPQPPTEHAAEALQIQMQCWDLMQQLYQAAADEEGGSLSATRLWTSAADALKHLQELQQSLFVLEDPRVYRTKALLGGCQLRAGQWGDAALSLADSLKSGEQYLGSWQSSGGAADEIELELAAIQTNLAQAYKDGGKYMLALDQLKAAQSKYEMYAKGSFLRAQCLVNLAAAEAAFGSFVVARDHYHLAEEIAGRLTPPEGQDEAVQELRAVSLLNQAMLYKSQNQLTEAEPLCDKAVQLREAMAKGKLTAQLIPYYVARSSLRIAIYQQSKAKNEAATLLTEAAADAQRAMNLLTEHGQAELRIAADVYHTLALAQHCQNQSASARKNWDNARSLAATHGRTTIQVRALNFLVEMAMQEVKRRLEEISLREKRKHTPAEAQQALTECGLVELSAEAHRLQQNLKAYPTVHYSTLRNHAQIQHTLGNHNDAVNSLHEAIDALEVPRTLTTGGDQARAEYFAQYQQAYELLVDWHCQGKSKNEKEALIASELRHNRTFLDQVRAAGVDLRADLDPRLVDEHDRLVAEYHRACARLRLAESGIEPSSTGDAIREQISDLEQQIRKRTEKLRDASPRYRELRVPATPAETGHAIDGLVTNEDLLLFYHVGGEHSRLFVGTRNPGQSASFKEYELKLPEEEAGAAKDEASKNRFVSATRLGQLVDDALAALSGVQKDPRQNKHLRQLSTMLLPAELQNLFRERRPSTVTVIADGPLQLLPFEALLIGDKYALEIEEFPPLQYVPSANIAHTIRQRQANESTAFVTVAAEYHGERLTLWQGKPIPLTPLPSAKQESEAVLAELSRARLRGVPLHAADAVHAKVLEELRGKRFIHLAAHGIVRQELGNLFGGFPLTQQKRGTEPQMLKLAEIFNLNLTSCELAALSACESNRGPGQQLEAGSTLARAFLAAGAQRVVCSHWNVDDAATSRLMTELFKSIGESLAAGKPPHYALALRDAKRQVRLDSPKDANWSLPKYWAPFVLIGPAEANPSPIQAARQ